MRNHVSEGKILTLTAPTGGVVSGTGYMIGERFVVAGNDAAQGDPFPGHIVGVFELPKTGGGGDVWTAGAPIYWNAAGGVATATKGVNKRIGFAVAAAADAATTGQVVLAGDSPRSFKSTEQTGTGSSQNVAHGLGVTPSLVWWSLSEFADTLAVDVAEGAHDATNLKFTVSSGAKFFAFAMV